MGNTEINKDLFSTRESQAMGTVKTALKIISDSSLYELSSIYGFDVFKLVGVTVEIAHKKDLVHRLLKPSLRLLHDSAEITIEYVDREDGIVFVITPAEFSHRRYIIQARK